VLKNGAESVAKSTGCTLRTRWVTKTRTGLPNIALADLSYENLVLAGPPAWTEEDKEKAREIIRNLDYEAPDEPYNMKLMTPQDWEARTRRRI